MSPRREATNVAASVRARLSELARRRGVEFQLVLSEFAIERLLYTKLPDWFLAFDIYDRSRPEFWRATRRNDFVQGLGLALVPKLGTGRFDLKTLQSNLDQSQLADGPAEGL